MPGAGVEDDRPRVAADLLRTVDGFLRPRHVNARRVDAGQRVNGRLDGSGCSVEGDFARSLACSLETCAYGSVG